jgi:hypothetical protein
MTLNKKKLNENSIIRVSTVVVLASALVLATFTIPAIATPLPNNPPNIPHNPGPANDSTNVSIYIFLNWTGGDPDGDPVTYDVYFGKVSSPEKVVANQSATTYNPASMNYSTTYYWRIIAWDNQSASATGPLWEFTTKLNSPPNVPSNPFPANGSINVALPVTLNWTGGDPDGDPVTYDVFFGTLNPPLLVALNHSGTSYNPGSLNYTTHYYWMIVAKDSQNTLTAGPLWQFTTGVKPNSPPSIPKTPNPANVSTNVALNAILSWVGGDPDGDKVTYVVYFGTTSSPPIVVNNQSTLSYTPGALSYNTIYYWKIVAWDNHSASTRGPLWHFTTLAGSAITVTISKPLEKTFYFQDQQRFSLLSNTIIYGPITITANVTSNQPVEKVEFYIDGTLKATVTSEPYTYLWRPIIQFNGASLKHSIKVIAYDTAGHNASAELNVTKWRFHPLPFIIAGVAIASRFILHTTITGFVFNLQQSKIGTSFYAIRIHYRTVGLIRNSKGIINFKHCTSGPIIGAISQLQMGPFHKFRAITCTFIGDIRQGSGLFGGSNQMPSRLLSLMGRK